MRKFETIALLLYKIFAMSLTFLNRRHGTLLTIRLRRNGNSMVQANRQESRNSGRSRDVAKFFRAGSTQGTKASLSDYLNLKTEESVVQKVRRMMENEGIDALVVPTDDPHMSEYVAPHFARREFVSGFTGSAGTALITRDSALLFTDGRYHSQAELELSNEWTLMRSGLKDVPSLSDYLQQKLSTGSVLGLDPFVHAAEPSIKLEKSLTLKNITVKYLKDTDKGKNPIDVVWGSHRPSKPANMIRLHSNKFAGKTSTEKIASVREKMKEKGAEYLVVSALDEIAWLYNIRGGDIPCNPVSICYAILGTDSAHLFIDSQKVSPLVAKELTGVTIEPYEQAISFLKNIRGNVWMDAKTANIALYNAVPAERKIEQTSPIILMKAIKNEVELAGMRACHLRDGAACAEFFSQLEEDLKSPDLSINEVDLDLRVTASRAALSPSDTATAFLEPSFPTIAGVNKNGAIVHYRAVPESCLPVGRNDLVLLDSGGQYLDGTTDVTRTFHTGTPTQYQKEMFTRVLKGNIGVDSRVFPTGTPGCQLDTFARTALWEVGKNYNHGTGHGVGAALNVHEGPHRISPLLDSQPLIPGMIVSNEPGYYEPGNFGIRIENLLVVVEKPELGEFGGRRFLGFDRLTHIPIAKNLLVRSLLTKQEEKWIDDYHNDVWTKVSPLLLSDRARAWLREATQPLSPNQ